MFVWTPINHGDGDKAKSFKVGDEVTQATLGVSDEEWAQLVEAKVVRKSQFPNLPPNWTGSPKEYRDKKLREQMEDMDDNFDDLDGDVVGGNSSPVVDDDENPSTPNDPSYDDPSKYGDGPADPELGEGIDRETGEADSNASEVAPA